MVHSYPFLVSGIVLGLLAGISPGPLLTLVISQTLKYNIKEGIKVSITPLATDLPIILFTVFLLAKLASFKSILGVISILGACFLIYLAYECIMYKEVKIEQDTSNAKSFRKGIITNFLNPYPYLFWLTVGAPILYSAYYNNILSIVLFLTGLYFSLVGSKIVIVFIVDRSKSLLKNTTYIYSVRILGLIILLFAFIFTKEGLLLLGLHF